MPVCLDACESTLVRRVKVHQALKVKSAFISVVRSVIEHVGSVRTRLNFILHVRLNY